MGGCWFFGGYVFVLAEYESLVGHDPSSHKNTHPPSFPNPHAPCPVTIIPAYIALNSQPNHLSWDI